MGIFKRNGKWVAQWPEGGKVHTQTVGKDKTAAQRLFNHKKENAVLRKHGLLDAEAERYAAMEARAYEDHVVEFNEFHKTKPITAKQRVQVLARIIRVGTAGNIRKLSELTETNVRRAIEQIRHQGYRIGRTQRHHSAETLNQHVKAIRQFVRWLVNDCRIRRSLLGGLSLFNVAVDRRHDRRALTDAEIAKLLDPSSLHQDKTCPSAISPRDRVMLYRVALGTGFRARELASLQRASFDLVSGTVTVRAGFSKHRREDVQPLPADLVTELTGWLRIAKSGPLFRLPGNMAKVFRKDLAAVGIAYVIDGKYADFHSLRHTFITRLVGANLPPKVAQTLARHSTITLTLDRYAHLAREGLANQLAKVPPLPSAVPTLQVQGKLGECEAYTVRTDALVVPVQAKGRICRKPRKTRGIRIEKETRPTGLEPVTVRLEGRKAIRGKHSPIKSYEFSPLRRCGGAVERHWAHCGAGKAFISLKMRIRKGGRR